jgi:NADH dehydrogenase
VAENILNLLEGRSLEHFQYHDPGVMATIGRNQAVAWIGRWKFRGFLAWLMWLGVHIYQLIGFRNRLAVLVDWAWSYIFYERASRLIGPK